MSRPSFAGGGGGAGPSGASQRSGSIAGSNAGGGGGGNPSNNPSRIKSSTLRRPLTPKYDPKDPVSSICFLTNMSKNFEEQENYLEAVKCAESALLLRKKNYDVIQEALAANAELKAAQIPHSITDQANALVTLCNTYAVCEFNAKRFDAASHFLNKALFLTDNAVEKTPGDLTYTVKKMNALSGTEKEQREQLPQEEEIATLCFVNDDSSRLRQRAATFNNLGCMERRRDLLPEALDYFKRAAQIEVRIDPNGLGSPSTYLNMCTVLNEMKRHAEAVPAAERAISSLQMMMPEQTTEEDLSNTAMMLAVGQYNLGVSLEKRGKLGDAKAAEKAYQLSLDTSRRYLLGAECPTVGAAIAAIKRMKVPRLAAELEQPMQESTASADGRSPAAQSSQPQQPVPGQKQQQKQQQLPPPQYMDADGTHRKPSSGDGTDAVGGPPPPSSSAGAPQPPLEPMPPSGSRPGYAPPPSSQQQQAQQPQYYNNLSPATGIPYTRPSPIPPPLQQQQQACYPPTPQPLNAPHGPVPQQQGSGYDSAFHPNGQRPPKPPTPHTPTSGILKPPSVASSLHSSHTPSLNRAPPLPMGSQPAPPAGDYRTPSKDEDPSMPPERFQANSPPFPQQLSPTNPPPPANPFVATAVGGSGGNVLLPPQHSHPSLYGSHHSPPGNGSGSGHVVGGNSPHYPSQVPHSAGSNHTPLQRLSGSAGSVGSANSANRSVKDLLRPPRVVPVSAPPPVLEPIHLPSQHSNGATPKMETSTSLRDMPHLSNPSIHSFRSGQSGQSRASRSNLNDQDDELKQSIASISRGIPSSSAVKNKMDKRRNSTNPGDVRGLFGRRTFSSTSLGSVPKGLGRKASMASSSKSKSMEDQKMGLLRNNRLHEKAQAQAKRQQQKEMAEYDAELAAQMCENMVKGMHEDQVRRNHRAATTIQRVWRGVMARTFITTMMNAVEKLQPAIRKFLVKARIAHQKEEEERLRREEEQRRRELAAVRVLQARVRQFIHRLNIRREFIARMRRNFFAARTIQRAYRDFCTRRAEHLAAIAEAHRREDEQQLFREKVAAKHIQQAYRQYKAMQKGRAAAEESHKQHRAAIVIQSLVRGVLTRAWFRYYRAYRRDQELRTVESIRRITIIQAACRAVASNRYCKEQHAFMVSKIRNRHLHDAATKIQCMWRQHVAKIHLERLQADRERLHRTATRIQRWYQTRVLRKKFLHWRMEKQREAAAVKIQRWVRELWQVRKEKAFAAYHNELLRKQRLVRLQAESATLLQACCKGIISMRMVKEKEKVYEMKCEVAKTLQRVCRGFVDRKIVATDKVIAKKIERMEFELALKTACARTIQRAWRCAMAKDKVEQMRREQIAATIIARSYRVYLAKKELAQLKADKRARIEKHAACVIQRRVRHFLRCVKFAQIAEYYKEQQRKKLWRMRRTEAAVMIQSVWRGHCTRKAVALERAALAELAVYAVKIQRAWRRSKEKVKVAQRAEKRQVFVQAALTIQCFWRKMRAADRVAEMRQQHMREVEAATKIQAWWRMMLAKRMLAFLQERAREEDRVAAIYAARWEKAVTVINSFLRTRLDQQQSLGRLRHYLIGKLTDKEREVFLKRHTAATKIQAVYRGFYERAVARYLRREKEAEERAKAEQAAKEQRAATRIQCAFRRFLAKRELRRRITEKRQAIVDNQEDFIASTDPHDIVRELFWVHNAVNRTQRAQKTVEDTEVTQRAATVIQQAFRQHSARRKAIQRRVEQKRNEAARVIQQHWRNHYRFVKRRDEERQLAAALVIQCHVRGWMVRKVWREWKEACEEQQRAFYREADREDAAVTSIQSHWRRITAERRTDSLRQRREECFQYNAANEAAALIQSAFRRHMNHFVQMHTVE